MYPLTAHKAQCWFLYCLLVLQIYKRKNKMFAFAETKEYVFIKCTYVYQDMHVVITCNYSCWHLKNRKNETNKESDSKSLSNQPGLRPVLHLRTHQLHGPSSAIPFFNSSSLIEIPKRSIHFLSFLSYRMQTNFSLPQVTFSFAAL